jgi:hypothetical protein
LPVEISSFSAIRNRSNVELSWKTKMEQNNSGFEVQRQLGTGNWQTLSFIPSQAASGNSNLELSYSYADLNTSRGISNYRLMQTDINGKSKYSEIRSVRGEGQTANTIVYPNPSRDGKVNIVFEGVSGVRDVSLTDISGRIINRWNGITDNNLRIENLHPGMYQLLIIEKETGEKTIKQVIVARK